MKKLRFAALVRVSTEKQEDRGASLRIQTDQIKEYVAKLDGYIPEDCWQYVGQEHATPQYERKILDKLLTDATKDKFDAVIVAEISRWSRDNAKSEEGIRIFQEHNVRFFAGTFEYDLLDPNHTYLVRSGVSMHQLQAEQMAKRSAEAKIEKAHRGEPPHAPLPWGRTFDKKTKQWDVEKDKKFLARRSAERYLAGESIPTIAKSYGMSPNTLYQLLKYKAGNTWTVHVRNKKFRIDETINIKIPELLDERMIKEVHYRMLHNRTFQGNVKNEYLLNRFVFCAKCGKARTGITAQGYSYYSKHSNNKTCELKTFISVKDLDRAVLLKLAALMGDPDLMKKSIERAQPNIKKRKEFEQERETCVNTKTNADKRKKRVIDNIADGILSKDEAREKLEQIRSEYDQADHRIYEIDEELSNLPTPEDIKKLTRSLGNKVLGNVRKQRPQWILKRPYEWKKQFIDQVFMGKDPEGNKYGVYIWYNDKREEWEVSLKGVFGENTISQDDFDNWGQSGAIPTDSGENSKDVSTFKGYKTSKVL